jgi:urease accessory protein
MLTITSIVGNVNDEKFREIYRKMDEAKVERIFLSRMEAQRARMRKVSDKGTDMAITVDRRPLRHGDVLFIDESRMIIAEYEMEDVLGFRIKEGLSDSLKIVTAIQLGHIIGNLHRQICIKGDVVYMPLQSESEVENIGKILGKLIERVQVKRGRMVFEPEEGEVHTH